MATSSSSSEKRELSNGPDWVRRDRERLQEFEFLRATECAALNSMQWVGKGEKEVADAAACDAIRGMFDIMDVRGEVVIGEGIKDQAPGLFKGEKVGMWRDGAPMFDIALDPIDGTTNVSKGLPNAISCIAAALRDDGELNSLQEIPAYYMNKLTYPPEVRAALVADPKLPIDINAPIEEVIRVIARILNKGVRDVVVMLLDRPRNQDYIDAIRKVGAALRMIGDGDIAAAVSSRSADVEYRPVRGNRRVPGRGTLRGRAPLFGRRDAGEDLAAGRGGEEAAH